MMEDSGDVRASPKRIKKSRWGPVTENDSPIKKLEGTEKVISNGTENVSPTSYSSPLVDDVNETPKPAKITKISKTVKADQLKEQSKSPQIEKPTEEKITSSCESPTTSHLQDGFCGFDDTTLSKYDTRLTKLKKLISSERENCGGVYITVERINVDENNSEAEEDIRREEDMTVHTGHVSESDTTDRDSNQMEIDIDKNSSPKSDDTELNVIEDKGDDRTKETDVDVDVEVIELEKDPVKESGVKPSRRNKRDMTNKTATIDDKNSSILENTLKGGNVNVEYCGVCESEVDDAEEGICCDGNCGRWFHLRCSGLTQIEYDELGLDENAKWACSKCSGKAPPVLRADAKPLLSVRKDLSKTPLPPSTLKRRSTAKEGSPRTPKLDISNPAFLKPFDFGWKRELVYRSTNENHNNRRQGDIYYYTPKGKKLRSLREISDHLIGSDLTPDNFTFWKEPLGIDDPAKEIIRDAKLKIANRDSSVTPNVPKKVTPKIIKSAKVTPKLTATVTPMDTVNSKMESPVATTSTPNATPSSKALASITPRVVFKNKTTSSSSTGPKFKVTPSKNSVPGQPPRVTITKDKKKKTTGDDDDLEMGMLPPMWDSTPKPKENNRSPGVKRPLERPEEAPASKRMRTDDSHAHYMRNFLQNVNYAHAVLLRAFQHLKVQELLRASRVCHMWRNVALHKDLWETVRMKNSLVKDWEGFSATLRRVGTRHLDLRKMLVPDKQDALSIMWTDCVKALSKVNTLVKLDLCRCTSQLLEQIATVCPQLEYISACAIKSKQLNFINIGNCTNLTELRLKSQGGLEVNNISVLPNLTKLKVLSLTTVKNMDNVLLLVAKMTHLETLELGEFTYVSETIVTECFSKLTKLKKLRLEKGQFECPTDAILKTISQLPTLMQLELVNFDVKVGFDEALGLCSNIKNLLIIPTYVTQSATTNHLVIEGVSKLSKTLMQFIWGLTLELLRVTDLFIDQWEMGRKNTLPNSPTNNNNQNQQVQPKKSVGDSIPILKPTTKDNKKQGKEAGVTQVDVLQLPKLHKVLTALLPNTKIIILKVPFSATWRQTITGSSQ